MLRKINAPTFAYLTVYGKYPNPPISGREAQHTTKNINGIEWDIHIPDKAIEILTKKDTNCIETRASCEGDSPRHLTFLIFRPISQDISTVKKIIKFLKMNGFKYVSYNIGQQGKYRICVSDHLYYSETNKKRFIRWWIKLAVTLKHMCNVI